MNDLFRNRNYVLLFFGSLVSELGNVLFGFAAGLYVADLTGKPAILGLFMALGAATRIVLSPVAGVFVDRWNRVRIIYITDWIRGLMFVAVGYVFMFPVNTGVATAILMFVAVVSGAIGALFGPAVTAAIPEIVGMDKVQQAMGANNIVQSMTSIFGVVLGMIAFGLFPFHIALLLNGISFILSGLSEMFIKTEFKEQADQLEEHEPFFTQLKFGLSYMKHRQGLLTMMIFSLFLNFAIAPLMSVGIPSLFRIQLQRSVWEIGWPQIAFSVAVLGASIVVGSMKLKNFTAAIRNNLALLVGSFIFISVLIYLLEVDILSYWVFYGLFVFANVLMAIFMIATNVPLNTGLVKVVDAKVRGRVFSTIGALASAATPIAVVLGGILIEHTSVAVLGIVCSVLLLIPTIGFVISKDVKTLLDGIDNENNPVVQPILELET